MKKLYGLVAIAVLICLSSCSPRISTNLSRSFPPLDYRQEVKVIGLNKPAPAKAIVIGQVKIGDTGFTTKCGYDVVVDKAKLAARKAGGNAIQIIDHRPPTVFGSTCHRITANILRIDNTDDIMPDEEINQELLNADYAILHVYRNSGAGGLISYNVHLGDTTICRVKNRYRKSIKIKKFGYNTLWAKTEAKTEVPVKIEPGHEYYIRCGITMGMFVGHPSLAIVNNELGEAEYAAVKVRESDKNDLLLLKDGREIECTIQSEDDENVYFSFSKDGNNIDTQISKDQIESIERAEQ